ncbi:MAG TPA: hypothetical protein P5079_04435 [Elusimicrobiota bacterium]|nr:hypothetical protein [Elusimicrobiota bacterium]
MEQQTRKAFQEIIFALLYIILFLVLMPPLIRLLDDLWGKILYGVLVAGAVAVAFRLRALSRR